VRKLPETGKRMAVNQAILQRVQAEGVSRPTGGQFITSTLPSSNSKAGNDHRREGTADDRKDHRLHGLHADLLFNSTSFWAGGVSRCAGRSWYPRGPVRSDRRRRPIAFRQPTRTTTTNVRMLTFERVPQLYIRL